MNKTPATDKPPLGPLRKTAATVLWSVGSIAVALSASGTAEAATRLLAVDPLGQVISNLRDVLVSLLVGLATLFLTIGGVRYILAGGDPGEVEGAKKTLKYAAIGYGVAVLAPVLVALLQQVVGG